MEDPPRHEGRSSARGATRRSGGAVVRASDATELELGRAEAWTLRQVRRRGTGGFVAIMTALSVVGSVVLVTLATVLVAGTDPDFLVPAMVLSAVAPAVVAPLSLVFNVRLAARLDTAGLLLRRAVLTDPLTGVLNRRGFFEALADIRESGHVVEIAMVDVDDFKQFNDRHGHGAGDRVLCDVAAWLVDLVGDAGTVARIGGDEFAYLAEPDPERLPSGRMSLTSGDTGCTVTIGHAICAAGEDPEAALVRADADLYRRKASGSGADPAPDPPA